VARPIGQAVLSRERILAAALRLIDQSGLDALSMRKLGTELGVDPMSIYHYFPNKDALLLAVVQDVFASMRVPPPTGPWKQRVRKWADAYRDVAVAHPHLVLQIVSNPSAVAVAAAHVNESLYGALEKSGLPAKTVVRAADLIVDYVNGSVLAVASDTDHDVDATAALRAEIDARPRDQTTVQRRLLSDPSVAENRDSFRFGLDIIFAGLDALASGKKQR
jgi:TetR/AcrR family transcriptional regulator, tetracycline repressor protein